MVLYEGIVGLICGYYVSFLLKTRQVEERPVALDELLDADEAFCTGTAVVVTSIGSVTHQGRRYSAGNSSSIDTSFFPDFPLRSSIRNSLVPRDSGTDSASTNRNSACASAAVHWQGSLTLALNLMMQGGVQDPSGYSLSEAARNLNRDSNG